MYIYGARKRTKLQMFGEFDFYQLIKKNFISSVPIVLLDLGDDSIDLGAGWRPSGRRDARGRDVPYDRSSAARTSLQAGQLQRQLLVLHHLQLGLLLKLPDL